MNWEWAALGDVLQFSTISIPILDSRTYRQVTIRPYPQEIAFKTLKSGLNFTKKRQLLLESGQFVISRYRVRRSIWGLVPPELDGAVVPHNYFTFALLPRLDAGYFAAFLSTARFKRAAIAACSVKGRLLLRDFQEISLPLPDLEIQCQIADLYQHTRAALAQTAAMMVNIAEIKAGVASDLLRTGNPAWESTRLGAVASVGRDLAGDYLLSVVSPDMLVLGTGSEGDMMRIAPKTELDVEFLYYVLENQQQTLRSALAAPSSTEEMLANFPLMLPTLYEQRKIASVLRQHDEVLLRLRQEQAALRKLVNGTMQLIFSGTLNLQEALPLLQNFL